MPGKVTAAPYPQVRDMVVGARDGPPGDAPALPLPEGGVVAIGVSGPYPLLLTNFLRRGVPPYVSGSLVGTPPGRHADWKRFLTERPQYTPRRRTVDRLRPIGRRLPPPIARALRPLGRRLWEPPMSAPVVPPRRPSAPRPEPLPIPDHHIPGREALVNWPPDPPPRYLGQLDPDFQRELAGRWADVRLEDCYFYHSVLLPDGSFVKGPWDLIDNESEYLGGIDLAGRSVLEYGPASGWLTVWMTQQGAEVVIIDIGWDLSTDLIPLATFDLEKTRRAQVARASQVVNSWWYVRKAYGHSARAVYRPSTICRRTWAALTCLSSVRSCCT